MVLTVQATEITTCAGNGQAGGSWMEVVERFLLDGIDGQRTGLTIDLADEYTIMIPSTATDARLSIGNMTMVGTDLTLHSPTLQLPIIPTLFHLQLFFDHEFHELQ